MDITYFHLVGPDQDAVDKLDDGSVDLCAEGIITCILNDFNVIGSCLDEIVELVHVHHVPDLHLPFKAGCLQVIQRIITCCYIGLPGPQAAAFIVFHDGILYSGL